MAAKDPDEQDPFVEKTTEVVVSSAVSSGKKDGRTEKKEHGYLQQILISLIAILGAVTTGLILGFSSVSLPQLTDASLNETDIYLNADQASWFASLTTISSPIGCLLGGPLADRFGRRAGMLIVNVPALIGWLLLSTATVANPYVIAQLYMGRVFLGFTAGLAGIPVPVYLAEIASSKRLRSMLLTWNSVSMTLGILLVYILGSVFRSHWQMIAVACGILPVLTIVLLCVFLPESPIWLMSKGREKDAMKSLKTLRGAKGTVVTPTRVKVEFDALVETCKIKDLETKRTRKTSKNVFKEYALSCRETLAALCRRESLKALFIMNGLFMFQQFSGYIVITYYSVDLLMKAGVSVDPYLATILLGLVQFLSGLVVSFILTRCGRRPMNIAGGSGLTLCMLGLGLNMQFSWFSGWFPLCLLTALVVFSMVGYRTIPWTILGEIFPLDVKGVAVGLSTCNVYLFSFVTIKLYPLLLGILHSNQAIFYLYATTSALGTLFVIVFQPETHNKTLVQIQQELIGEKRLAARAQAAKERAVPV